MVFWFCYCPVPAVHSPYGLWAWVLCNKFHSVIPSKLWILLTPELHCSLTGKNSSTVAGDLSVRHSMVHTGNSMCLTTLSLKNTRTLWGLGGGMKVFIGNHVKIPLGKRVIFSLILWKHFFFQKKNQQTRFPFMDCKCHPTQENF